MAVIFGVEALLSVKCEEAKSLSKDEDNQRADVLMTENGKGADVSMDDLAGVLHEGQHIQREFSIETGPTRGVC